VFNNFLDKKGSQILEIRGKIKWKGELTLIWREAESKSLQTAWISSCSASVFNVVVMYFPMWHPTLIKFGS
jgi:hypothetical protein